MNLPGGIYDMNDDFTGMEHIQEMEPTVAEKMVIIKERLDKHKKAMKTKSNMANMQGSVDRMLFKAANIGADVHGAAKVINILRRGWVNSSDMKENDTEHKKYEVDSDTARSLSRINSESPETNV